MKPEDIAAAGPVVQPPTGPVPPMPPMPPAMPPPPMPVMKHKVHHKKHRGDGRSAGRDKHGRGDYTK